MVMFKWEKCNLLLLLSLSWDNVYDMIGGRCAYIVHKKGMKPNQPNNKYDTV